MFRVAIIDYGLCNLDSIRRAVELCGAETTLAREAKEVESAERIVLPGVGNFAKAMSNLHERGLDRALHDAVARQTPLLGICLGMQLLASFGEEGGGREGLGLVPGRVILMQPRDGERVPHMGWNSVVPATRSVVFDGIAPGADFYFVHSYHLACDAAAHVAARTPYCGGIVAAVQNGNVFGTQFHPEKSQRAGRRLLTNFLTVRHA
jgi:imidazole glycerol-phosphate synthase subunit HisH